jgi:glycosyltransferase involved in cell wall biosynthesis
LIYFSIIIPVFNRQDQIGKCVRSILNQNFQNFEIILIDDNSKDKTLDICEKIKKEDDRVKILSNKKNLGVGKTRNRGILKAKGKYILFIDSDDEIKRNSLLKIAKETSKNKGINFIVSDHDINIDGKLYKKNINDLKNNDKIKHINSITRFNGYCWRFIILNKFLKKFKIKFCNARIYEDEEFVSNLIFHSNKFIFSKINFYKKTTSTNSLSLSISEEELYSCIIVIKKLINNYLRQKQSISKKIFTQNRLDNVLKNFFTIIFFHEKKFLKEVSKNFCLSINFNKYKKIDHLFGLTSLKRESNILISAKKIIEQSTLKKINKLKEKEFYLYCLDKSSFATYKILKKNNFKIKGFMDTFLKTKKKIFNTRVFSISKKNFQTFHNSIILISNQTNYNITQIINHLVNSGLKKKNILIKKYTKNLKGEILTVDDFKKTKKIN